MSRSGGEPVMQLSHKEQNQWYAGAPLKKNVGEYVVSQGVIVFPLYGRFYGR